MEWDGNGQQITQTDWTLKESEIVMITYVQLFNPLTQPSNVTELY